MSKSCREIFVNNNIPLDVSLTGTSYDTLELCSANCLPELLGCDYIDTEKTINFTCNFKVGNDSETNLISTQTGQPYNEIRKESMSGTLNVELTYNSNYNGWHQTNSSVINFEGEDSTQINGTYSWQYPYIFQNATITIGCNSIQKKTCMEAQEAYVLCQQNCYNFMNPETGEFTPEFSDCMMNCEVDYANSSCSEEMIPIWTIDMYIFYIHNGVTKSQHFSFGMSNDYTNEISCTQEQYTINLNKYNNYPVGSLLQKYNVVRKYYGLQLGGLIRCTHLFVNDMECSKTPENCIIENNHVLIKTENSYENYDISFL